MRFSKMSPLPRRWVNNGFENWSGHALIHWPERKLGLDIQSDKHFSRYFLFISDTDFDPDCDFDFFCFEPMTHSANGQNLSNLGGLKTLSQGQEFRTSIDMRWFEI